MPCCFVVYCSMYRTTMEVGTKTDFNISSYSLSAFLKSKIAVGTVGTLHLLFSLVQQHGKVPEVRYDHNYQRRVDELCGKGTAHSPYNPWRLVFFPTRHIGRVACCVCVDVWCVRERVREGACVFMSVCRCVLF